MKNKTLLNTERIGTALTSICCVTPAIVVFTTGVGLTTALAHVDFINVPGVAVFFLITLYALWRQQKRSTAVNN